MSFPRTVAAIAAFLALIAASVAAQPAPDDFITLDASTDAVVQVNLSTKSVSKVVAIPGTLNAVIVDERNSGLFVLNNSSTAPAVLRVNSAGAVSTLTALPSGSYRDLAIDQDGSILIAATGRLMRFDGFQSQLTTVVSAAGTPTCVAVDHDTGHFLLGDFNRELILQVHRRTGAITTIASGSDVERINDLAHDPRTGNYVFVRSFPNEIVVMDRQGSIIRKAATNANQGIWIDDETGDFYTSGGDEIVQFKRTLSIVTTQSVSSGASLFGLTRFASRNVIGFGNALANGIFRINANFPDSPNASYGAAVSTGMRPGIPTAGRMIDLRPEPLFFASAAGMLEGFFTSGFIGTTSNNGNAFMQMTVPQHLPVGRTLYISVNAVNQAKKGNLDLGNTISFTPRP